MDPNAFASLVAEVTAGIAGRPLDAALEAELNRRFPAGGAFVEKVADACATGMAQGWICAREHAGIRYGRVVKPGPGTHGFSVDVVLMADVEGGHHRHPNGEIDLVMPLTAGAAFDGRPAGWVVYGPDSAHVPAVTDGTAFVLYLLPQGAIEFTKT